MGLFTITAAVPAVIMAVVGAVALDRGLYPAFVDDVGRFIAETKDAGKLIRSKQCDSLQRDADLAAVRPGAGARRLHGPQLLPELLRLAGPVARVHQGRGHHGRAKGRVTEQVDTGKLRPGREAERGGPRGRPRRASRSASASTTPAASWRCAYLPAFDNGFLYVERPLDPFTIGFQQHAEDINQLFGLFDAHRRSIQFAFIVMYGLLATIMLLSAIWLGLSFANLLVAPIRRLIDATDQVSSGNLYVQVPVRRSEGDLARLGETFNKMISELRLQQNRLIAARETIDERRLFTEAVLSGVPAASSASTPRGTSRC